MLDYKYKIFWNRPQMSVSLATLNLLHYVNTKKIPVSYNIMLYSRLFSILTPIYDNTRIIRTYMQCVMCTLHVIKAVGTNRKRLAKLLFIRCSTLADMLTSHCIRTCNKWNSLYGCDFYFFKDAWIRLTKHFQ